VKRGLFDIVFAVDFSVRFPQEIFEQFFLAILSADMQDGIT
jgi:hypothetical protein